MSAKPPPDDWTVKRIGPDEISVRTSKDLSYDRKVNDLVATFTALADNIKQQIKDDDSREQPLGYCICARKCWVEW